MGFPGWSVYALSLFFSFGVSDPGCKRRHDGGRKLMQALALARTEAQWAGLSFYRSF